MERLEVLFQRSLFIDNEILAVVEEFPELPEEAVHAVDSLRIPRLGLFDRA